MYGLFSLLTTLGTDSMFSNTSALQITTSTIGGTDLYLYTEWAKAEIYYYNLYQESVDAVSTEINRVLGLEEYPLPNKDFSFSANVEFNPNDPSVSKINSGKTPLYKKSTSSSTSSNTTNKKSQSSQTTTTPSSNNATQNTTDNTSSNSNNSSNQEQNNNNQNESNSNTNQNHQTQDSSNQAGNEVSSSN